MRKYAAGHETQVGEQLAKILHSLEEDNVNKHLQLATVEGMVQILPCQFQAPDRATELHLSLFLHKLIPELSGIWLAHSDIVILDSAGYGSEAEQTGCVVVGIRVKVLLFRPAPSEMLVGVVTSVGETSVSLLVFGLYSATITERNLCGFTFNAKRHCFESGKQVVEEGATLTFHVESFQFGATGEGVTIEGKHTAMDRVIGVNNHCSS